MAVETTTDTQTKVLTTIGRRKTASARVRLTPGGSGKYKVNGKPLKEYLRVDGQESIATRPFSIVETDEQFDLTIRVEGGGAISQAGAISHGLARALEKYQADWRLPLKQAGLLRRDPREKERKKAGQPGARKRFQFSKR